MSEYTLKIQQIVDYPRCRIYRKFVQALISDQNIRVKGCSSLFHYTVLCSYANFRTSYRRLDGISYTVYPGEWILRLSELKQWLRLRTQRQTISALCRLQDLHLIQFTQLGRGHIIRYRIVDWRYHNTVLDYSCPCQKDDGFFFLPVATALDLISIGKCSEMDILLDLWISAVYNDDSVQGSSVGPVVYFRNGSGNPLVSYSQLAQRWGHSKATISRILKKLEQLNYLSLMTFKGRYGTAIYLKNYLSTMFQISDILLDKDEVALSLQLKIHLDSETNDSIVNKQLHSSTKETIVSNPLAQLTMSHVIKLLENQGIACANCPKFHYKLYSLSDDCKKEFYIARYFESQQVYRLDTFCDNSSILYRFDLLLNQISSQED